MRVPVPPKTTSSTKCADIISRCDRKTTIAVIGFALVFVFFSVVFQIVEFSSTFTSYGAGRVDVNGVAERKHNKTASFEADVNDVTANEVCSSVCTQRRRKRSESIDGSPNLMDPLELIRQVSAAKEKLLGKLREDYGEYFEPIFVHENTTNGYRPFGTLNDVSTEQLKRKLMIKALSMQSAFESQDSDFKGCDCSFGKDKTLRKNISDFLDPGDASVVFDGMGAAVFEKYVWATGGHSIAAGHGNLYNESYTAYMERDLKGIFGSIGIDFEGRNHAMGAINSATAVSMCWKEIFGEDTDFFVYDYALTDLEFISLMLHYIYRGALSVSRPAAMMMPRGGRHAPTRYEVFEQLKARGLTVFFLDDKIVRTMKENVPDSFGLSEKEIDALPEYVRNYRCGSTFEHGEPYCRRDKFSTWGCSESVRRHQQNWHPGFKGHALYGHSLSLFLTEALLGALRDLSKLLEVEDRTLLLSRLRQEDIELHNNFLNAELPDLHKELLNLKFVNPSDNEPIIDNALFFKGPSMCHTAYLPSQTRYLGILTDTNQVGGPAPFGEEAYFMGIEKEEALKTPPKNNQISLVYDINSRERKCEFPVTIKQDFEDAFLVNDNDSWAEITFPNNAEKRFYRYNPNDYQGILMLHSKSCKKCTNILNMTNLNDNAWEMKVNRQDVKEIIRVGGWGFAWFIVKGANGFHFEPDTNGQYTIEIKVNKKEHYLEIFDFVIY